MNPADAIYDWDMVRDGLYALLATEPGPERVGCEQGIGSEE